MPLPSLALRFAVYITTLFGLTLAHSDLQIREVCYYDDYLSCFNSSRADSEPYCSSLLSIHDVTSTLPPAISRTTSSVLLTTLYETPDVTVTIAQATSFSTVTSTVREVAKRDLLHAGPIKARYATDSPVQSLAASAGENATIASSVYSACSCLQLRPSTVETRSTLQLTRTIDGIDYEANPTVHTGTEVVVVTTTIFLAATSTPLPQSDSSIQSAGLANNTDLSPSLILSTSSLIPTVTVTSSTVVVASISVTSSAGPSSSEASSFPPTTPSISVSLASVTSTVSVLPEESTSSSTYLFSVSSLSVNSSHIVPTPSASMVLSTQPSELPSNVSSPTRVSSVATSSFVPIGTSLSTAGCPSINNTEYILADTGDTYQIQCYRAYSGPTLEGLNEPHSLNCMEVCSEVNRGFSNITCYGITYQKFAVGTDCFLRTQAGLETYITDQYALSAVLLTGVNATVGIFGGSSQNVNPPRRPRH